MKRAAPIQRRTVRHLRHDEPRPDAEPRKYKSREGYTRLRWKVGTNEYVEAYERDENGNLVRDRPNCTDRIDIAEARRLYEDGHGLIEIGKRMNRDAGALSRALRRDGVQMRTNTDYAKRMDVDEVVRLYVEERLGPAPISRMLNVDPARIRNALRERGVLRTPGRPGNAFAEDSYETEFKKIRPLVLERAKGMCEVPDCERSAAEVHHRKTRGQRGKNELGNLLACCASHHRWIHHNVAGAYERGLLVKSWQTPAEVPIT